MCETDYKPDGMGGSWAPAGESGKKFLGTGRPARKRNRA